MPDVNISTRRILRMMDQQGHTSFGWDAEDDEWVLPMIRRKMDEGYVFWIVRRRPLREVELTRVEDIGENRHVIIRDQDARTLFEEGRIGLVQGDADEDEPVVTERRARTPEEVVANDTVAHRSLRGG
jgi:hypothetical protein